MTTTTTTLAKALNAGLRSAMEDDPKVIVMHSAGSLLGKLRDPQYMGCGGTVDYLVDTVFNYPTLAESYKVAALDAVNKMRAIARVTQTGPYHPLPE